MTVLAPTDLAGALSALREHPDAHVLAGGTDFLVEVNAGLRRPSAVVSLRRVAELRGWRRAGDEVVLGAGLTYTDMADPALAALHPALADAARTVGSPQIRNAGTLGGNVATASPAGDTLPVLAALDAVVELRDAAGGGRALRWDEFFLGVKRTARRDDELITAVRLPVLDSVQQYLKVGTRNAMVISVAGLALVVDHTHRTVRCALGSVGPVPLRASDAEAWVAGHIDWDDRSVPDPASYVTFASMVAATARPIDDHRSTAAYRRHAVAVLARRALMRAFEPA